MDHSRRFKRSPANAFPVLLASRPLLLNGSKCNSTIKKMPEPKKKSSDPWENARNAEPNRFLA
jgi:hypothetical protein